LPAPVLAAAAGGGADETAMACDPPSEAIEGAGVHRADAALGPG
jgi:hypothetical protein